MGTSRWTDRRLFRVVVGLNTLVVIVVIILFTRQEWLVSPSLPSLPRTVDVYLVTGGAGFIGSHLIDRLLQSHVGVVLLDNFSDYYAVEIKRKNVAFLRRRHHRAALAVVEGSINDKRLLKRIFVKYRITHIAHLAALPGVRSSRYDTSQFVEVNTIGTEVLLDAATSSSRRPLFVFTSTSSVYGQSTQVPFVETDACARPLSPYAASKRSAELLAHVYHRLHALNITILRLFNVYGPRGRPDMMPFQLMRASLEPSHGVDLYGDGQAQRDWTYIDDVVDAIVVALRRPLGYEVINVGYGAPVPLTDFIDELQRVTNRSVRVHTKQSYRTEASITHCDNRKARQLLDFAPKVNVSDGLKRTWCWFEQEYGKNRKHPL